jgi:hypothetical protein
MITTILGCPCDPPAAEPGGMLLYSIPPYRLPKDVVRRQVQALKGMGIKEADLEHILERRSLKEMKRILDDNGIKHVRAGIFNRLVS